MTSLSRCAGHTYHAKKAKARTNGTGEASYQNQRKSAGRKVGQKMSDGVIITAVICGTLVLLSILSNLRNIKK